MKGQPKLSLAVRLGISQVVSWGCLYYAFSALLPAMESSLPWGQTVLTAGFSGALLFSGILAPSVGAWIEKHGPRGTLLGGSIAGVIGLWLWAAADSVLLYGFAWLLLGTAMSATLYAPAFATLVRADPQTAPRNIWVVSLWGALASTLFVPLGAWLAEAHSWRFALALLSGIFLLTQGWLIAGLPADSSPAKTPEEAPKTSSENAPAAYRHLAVALMLANAASVAFHTHLVVFAIAAKLPLSEVAIVAALPGIGKLLGRLGLGALTERSGLRLLQGCAAASVFAYAAGISASVAGLALAAFLLGIADGVRTVARPMALLELFGDAGFGKRDGALQLASTVAYAIGPIACAGLLATSNASVAHGALTALATLAALVLFATPTASRSTPLC